MTTAAALSVPAPVRVWGVALTPITFPQTLDLIDRLIAERKPGYFITANLHYAMLTAREPRLAAVNEEAAFILADGMPLVWASRWRSTRLPERVTGADLFPALCERAAARQHRIFLLGGAPGVAEEAARKMSERFPGLQVVGIEAPPFRPLTPEEQAAMFDRIRAARPDLLFVAFGQPKGEIWLHEHYRVLDVPVCVQVGASIDFAAGRVRRSPRWLQRIGLEWAYRLVSEPRRLLLRYAQNFFFALRMLAADAFALVRRKQPG
jgi:N-acetylglucosaminyldiphosphoundecaprenol N-acetyl-beta-D-mannosaminyltransferase